jgi:hypothetical protein
MRIAFVEWPDALSTSDAQWDQLKDGEALAQLCVLDN